MARTVIGEPGPIAPSHAWWKRRQRTVVANSSGNNALAVSQNARVKRAETPRRLPGPLAACHRKLEQLTTTNNRLAGRAARCVSRAFVSASASSATNALLHRQVKPADDCQAGGPKALPNSRSNCTWIQGCRLPSATAIAATNSGRRQRESARGPGLAGGGVGAKFIAAMVGRAGARQKPVSGSVRQLQAPLAPVLAAVRAAVPVRTRC
jgi:hypothetical protein